jgi:hypothetical protein
MAENDPVSAFKDSRLMEQVRHSMRLMHIAKRTEEAYVRWIDCRFCWRLSSWIRGTPEERAPTATG